MQVRVLSRAWLLEGRRMLVRRTGLLNRRPPGLAGSIPAPSVAPVAELADAAASKAAAHDGHVGSIPSGCTSMDAEAERWRQRTANPRVAGSNPVGISDWSGGRAWLIAPVLKTGGRKARGFESHPLRCSPQTQSGNDETTMNTLVLAPSFSPIVEIPVRRAVRLVLEGKAQSLKDHPTRVFRNPTGRVRIPAPLVVVLESMADFAGVVFGHASWSRVNVYLRDNFTCQYCGRHQKDLVRGSGEVMLRYGSVKVRVAVSNEHLTVDHVTPQSQGGKNEFRNTVAACSTCNGRKDDRRPAEAGMYLRRKPRDVTRAEMFLARLSDEARSAVEDLYAEPL